MIYTLKIDNTEQALRMIEFLKTLDFIELTEEPEEEPFDADALIKGLEEKPEEEYTLLEQIAAGLKDVKNGNVRPIEELLTELEEERSAETETDKSIKNLEHE